MKKSYEKADMWRFILTALTYWVVGREVKTDKKGREFISFKFNNDKTRIKSLVVYTTKKEDVRILINMAIANRTGKLCNKSFCYLLKNINKEEFFLICGKERLANHNKQEILSLFEEGRKPWVCYDEDVVSDGWVDHSDGDDHPF
jgi:hypothetical protein